LLVEIQALVALRRLPRRVVRWWVGIVTVWQ